MKKIEISPLPWGHARALVLAADGGVVAYASSFANAEHITRCVSATGMERVFNERNPGDINDIAAQVKSWADDVIPDRNIGIMALKLYEEIGEWIRDPSSRHEFADIMILLLDAAVMFGITDIDRAILEKLAINRARTWKRDAIGTLSHEEES